MPSDAFGLLLTAPWALQAIGEYDHTARDWGTLVPEVQMYSQDIVPGIKVNMADRVAIMRKGGLIRVKDYTPSGQVIASDCSGLLCIASGCF